jgi:hypothetical protein
MYHGYTARTAVEMSVFLIAEVAIAGVLLDYLGTQQEVLLSSHVGQRRPLLESRPRQQYCAPFVGIRAWNAAWRYLDDGAQRVVKKQVVLKEGAERGAEFPTWSA